MKYRGGLVVAACLSLLSASARAEELGWEGLAGPAGSVPAPSAATAVPDADVARDLTAAFAEHARLVTELEGRVATMTAIHRRLREAPLEGGFARVRFGWLAGSSFRTTAPAERAVPPADAVGLALLPAPALARLNAAVAAAAADGRKLGGNALGSRPQDAQGTPPYRRPEVSANEGGPAELLSSFKALGHEVEAVLEEARALYRLVAPAAPGERVAEALREREKDWDALVSRHDRLVNELGSLVPRYRAGALASVNLQTSRRLDAALAASPARSSGRALVAVLPAAQREALRAQLRRAFLSSYVAAHLADYTYRWLPATDTFLVYYRGQAVTTAVSPPKALEDGTIGVTLRGRTGSWQVLAPAPKQRPDWQDYLAD